MNYNLLVENFLEVLASEKGLSKNTLYSYKNDLDQFIDFIQKKNLESINFRDREIKEFISTFKKIFFKIRTFKCFRFICGYRIFWIRKPIETS